MFFEPISGDEGTFADSDDFMPTNLQQEWNQYNKKIKEIKSRGNIKLANSMSSMFYGCSSLANIDALKNWNTNNVTSMSYMFYGCSSLMTVGLSNTNKDIIFQLPTNETSTLSSEYHKVGTTKKYTLSELQQNWNSSFEGIWSREKLQDYTIHFNTNGTGAVSYTHLTLPTN